MTKDQLNKVKKKDKESQEKATIETSIVTATSSNENTVAESKPIFEPKTDEIVLDKYDCKGWFKSLLLGFILGIAVVVPGISGAAIAIIFKLYDKLLYAVGNIFKKFKTCFLYLLPIILGIIVGFVVGFLAVKALLKIVPFSMILLFAGLMIGALPSITNEIKGSKKNGTNLSLLILGILIPLAVTGLTVYLSRSSIFTNSTTTSTAGSIADSVFGETYPIWLYLVMFPIGMVLGLTQVIPGLSATAFLMMVGYYSAIVDTVDSKLAYWKAHPQIFIIYLALALGFLVGYFLTSKVMSGLLKKNRSLTYHAIVGLSIGSIVTMFVSSDMFQDVYVNWYYNGIDIRDLLIGIVLLLVGFAISFGLVLYSRKKDKQTKSLSK
jgi:putative membrane protein